MSYKRSRGYGDYGDESDTPITADDARRQYENAMQGGGLQSLTVQKDEQGNGTLLGFKIPKELLPAVETAIPNATLWLQRAGSEFSYDKALKLAEKLKFKDAKAKTAAAVVEHGVRWGLIGIKQIVEAISNTKIYSRQRKELFKEFQPVIQATGIDYKNNEVIKNAFNDLHDDMVTNMKLLAADLFTLAPMIYVGVKDHKAAAKKRALGIEGEISTNLDHATKDLDERFKRVDAQAAYDAAYEKKIKEKRVEYVKKHQGKRLKKDGTKYSVKELADEYDEIAERVAQETRWERERALEAKYRGEHDRDGQHKGEFAGEHIAFLGLSLGSQIIKTNIRDAAARHIKDASAWNMIKHLKEELDGQIERGTESASDNIYITTENGRLSVKEYILEIFQQHERDRMSQGSRAERQKINPLGPALVEQLMPTVDLIAEYLCEGRLDAYALINLVGDNKVVVHKSSGARGFAKKEEVTKIIDNLLATMGTHEAVKPEEFFANFADPALIQNTLKKNLLTMQGIDKAFFISLFPDVILEQAGMRKSDIMEQRKAAHHALYDIMAASVMIIAEQDVEVLKKLGLTEKQVADIQTLAEKIEAGDTKPLQVAVDNKSLVGAIRTFGLKQQAENIGEGARIWTQIVEKARSVPDIIAERKQRREQKHAQEVPASMVDHTTRDEAPLGTRGV